LRQPGRSQQNGQKSRSLESHIGPPLGSRSSGPTGSRNRFKTSDRHFGTLSGALPWMYGRGVEEVLIADQLTLSMALAPSRRRRPIRDVVVVMLRVGFAACSTLAGPADEKPSLLGN
jgi:hypothetical protein